MADNIKLFNSYLKGFKTIKGNFPVFMSNSVLNCQIGNIAPPVIDDSSLKEAYEDILITDDSDQYDLNIILFDIYGQGTYYFITL
jgi:hypothetical protein